MVSCILKRFREADSLERGPRRGEGVQSVVDGLQVVGK